MFLGSLGALFGSEPGLSLVGGGGVGRDRCQAWCVEVLEVEC